MLNLNTKVSIKIDDEKLSKALDKLLDQIGIIEKEVKE